MSDFSVVGPYAEFPYAEPWSADAAIVTSALTLRTDLIAVSDDIGRVRISWPTPSGDYDEVQLVRSFYGAPVHPEEGTVLVKWDPTKHRVNDYTDTRGGAQPFAYYTLFTHTTDAIPRWVVSGQTEAVFIQDRGGLELLWNNLPDIYRTMDDQYDLGSGGPLYRFFRLLSIEVNRILTVQEHGLRNVNNIEKMPAALVKATATKLSSAHERTVGDIRLRATLKEIMALRKMKGTRASIEGLVEAMSGWEATALVGRNILPLRDDGDFVGSSGNWVIASGGSLGFKTDPVPGPVSAPGYLEIAADETTVEARSCDEADAVTKGIRVDQGVVYSLSAYLKAGVGYSATWALGMRWYDVDGEYLSSDTTTGSEVNDTTYTRISGSVTAPDDAVFGILTLSTSDAVAGEEYYVDQIMVEVGAIVSTYEPPRKVWIYVSPNRINRALNPSWENGSLGVTTEGTTTVEHITDGSVARRDGTNSVKVTIGDTTSVRMGSYPLNPNRQFAYSCYVYTNALGRDGTVTLVWKSNNGATISSFTSNERNLNNGEWTRVRGSATAPINATSVEVHLDFPDADSSEEFWLDDQLVEDTLAVLPYFDGDSDGGSGGYYNEYLWRGAPNSSLSVFYMHRDIRHDALVTRLANVVPNSADYEIVFDEIPVQDESVVISAVEITTSHT